MRSNFGLTQSITREQVKKTRGSFTTTVSVIRGETGRKGCQPDSPKSKGGALAVGEEGEGQVWRTSMLKAFRSDQRKG